MNKDIKALWVAELRNPNVKQNKLSLRAGFDDDTSFCCLGVLCNLHAMAHPEIAATQTDPIRYLGEKTFLPTEVMTWAGLTHWAGDKVNVNKLSRMLSSHNDNGVSFLEIASAIESQL